MMIKSHITIAHINNFIQTRRMSSFHRYGTIIFDLIRFAKPGDVVYYLVPIDMEQVINSQSYAEDSTDSEHGE